MSAPLDLTQLAIDRNRKTGGGPSRPSRPFARYVLPAVVLLGFAGLLTWAARDQWLPARPVTVVPVLVTRSEVRQAGQPLLQAAGWVEPRPSPILVSALADGVVQEVLVVEGQDVAADQPVARLLTADAKLALAQAEADLALRRAQRAEAEAEFDAAQQRQEQPLHLDAALGEVNAQIARLQAEIVRLPFLREGIEARIQYAEQTLTGRQAAGEAIAQRLTQEARRERDAALAERKELDGREKSLKQELAALTARQDAIARQRELLIEETRAVKAATAQLAAAKAYERQAELAVETAELRLERMTILAPTAGRVLNVVARPGSRTTGLLAGTEHSSNTIITLYDPQRLQVRADVRLEDVPLVQVGQPVTLETAAAKEPFAGRVLAVTSSANIQKNTLEVKIAVDAPPQYVRPEMLVSATFLAPETSGIAPQPRERLLIPRPLVMTGADGQASVWLADAQGLARRQPITLGRGGTEELVEVMQGLAPTDRLISSDTSSLTPGMRIRITEEDAVLGKTAQSR